MTAQNIRELITLVAENHLVERSTVNIPKNNEYANSVKESSKIFDELLDNNYKSKCSVGEGNWADVPWIGIFDSEVTIGAQNGPYIVYLFSTDMKRVYLSQGQGVTEVKKEFQQKGLKNELLRRCSLIQSRVPEFKNKFTDKTIKLNGNTTLAKNYEPAVAFSIEYQIDNLPSNATLEENLFSMIELYSLLIARGGTDNSETVLTFDNVDNNTKESLNETKKYIRHRRIERNSTAAKKAKEILGTNCQGCDLSFEKIYGYIGANFIEAHHKVPLSSLQEGQQTKLNPEHDFAVLCSNCHRMVHKTKPTLTLEELRNLDGVKALRNFYNSN
jgi:5-methylcytosine-specific restriction enzyme A